MVSFTRLPAHRECYETCPADQKKHTANGRDRPKYADSRERQRVQTPGKQENAGEEGPPGHRQEPCVSDMSYRGRDNQYRERVIHVITDTGIEDLEHLRRKTTLQAMRSESSECYAEKTQYCSNQQKRSIHCGNHTYVRRPTLDNRMQRVSVAPCDKDIRPFDSIRQHRLHRGDTSVKKDE